MQRTAEDIDNVVTAELPSEPKRDEFENTPGGEDEFDAATNAYKKLTHRILTSMLHRDCTDDPTQPCRKKDSSRCEQHYPRAFVKQTVWNQRKVYPQYRRRKPADGGAQVVVTEPGGHVRTVDNSWVVPHNRFLVLKYDCHINTEVRRTILHSRDYLEYFVNAFAIHATKNIRKLQTELEFQSELSRVRMYQVCVSVGSVKYLYKYVYKGLGAQNHRN